MTTLPSMGSAICTTGFLPAPWSNCYLADLLRDLWRLWRGTMEIECPFQRLIHKEKHLLPTLVLLAGWPSSTCSYSHSVQKVLHLSFPFLHCIQKLLCLPTGWTQALVFTLVQPKAPVNPVFLPFKILPSWPRKHKALISKADPSVSKEHFILDGFEMCSSGYQTFFFLRQSRTYLVKWVDSEAAC